MVFISMIFIWFYAGCKYGCMTSSCHGYFMYLLVIFKRMDARPNSCYNRSMEKVMIILVTFHKCF